MHNFVTITMFVCGIVAGVLFVVAVPLMLGLMFSYVKDERELKRGRKHVKKVVAGRHRVETPAEKVKRENREEKEAEARKDAFFTNWWEYGSTAGLDRPLEDPRYNLDNTNIHILQLQLAELDADQNMLVFSEGH